MRKRLNNKNETYEMLSLHQNSNKMKIIFAWIWACYLLNSRIIFQSSFLTVDAVRRISFCATYPPPL